MDAVNDRCFVCGKTATHVVVVRIGHERLYPVCRKHAAIGVMPKEDVREA